MGHINMRLFLIQKIQECVWKEKCWHLVRTSTIWFHDWSWKRCATSVWIHLQLVTKWTHDALTIHQWKSCEKVFSTFQIHVYQNKWLLANVCWLSWFELVYHQELIPPTFDFRIIRSIESHQNVHQDWFTWNI